MSPLWEGTFSAAETNGVLSQNISVPFMTTSNFENMVSCVVHECNLQFQALGSSNYVSFDTEKKVRHL